MASRASFQRVLPDIEPKIAFARRFIDAVTVRAVLGEDRLRLHQTLRAATRSRPPPIGGSERRLENGW